MMKVTVFDSYVLKILSTVLLVTALSLTAIVLLTQSIRFLELIIASDASAGYFFILMGLAVPKFLEAILPIAFSIAVIFTCARLMSDREIIIMTAAGVSPRALTRPFVIFAIAMMAIQFMLSGWIAPSAITGIENTKNAVRSHYATILFREGVFNTIRPGMTAFIESRSASNELQNLMIHDKNGTLQKGKETTIIAKRGLVNMDDNNQQILVFDGTQYLRNLETDHISRLDFAQYTLNIPQENAPIGPRWREPDERNLQELIFPSEDNIAKDAPHQDEFFVEINRRLSTPFLYLSYALTALSFLLMGNWDRRRQSQHVVKASIAIIGIQVIYLAFLNLVQDYNIAAIMLYGIPTTFCLWAYHRLNDNKALPT